MKNYLFLYNFHAEFRLEIVEVIPLNGRVMISIIGFTRLSTDLKSNLKRMKNTFSN